MTLGSEIRRRRLALGLTLDDLSERSGMSPHYLSTLENDRRDPHLSTLVAVAKGLRITAADLLASMQTAAAKPDPGALYENAPPEARQAITTLLRLIVAPRRRARATAARK